MTKDEWNQSDKAFWLLRSFSAPKYSRKLLLLESAFTTQLLLTRKTKKKKLSLLVRKLLPDFVNLAETVAETKSTEKMKELVLLRGMIKAKLPLPPAPCPITFQPLANLLHPEWGRRSFSGPFPFAWEPMENELLADLIRECWPNPEYACPWKSSWLSDDVTSIAKTIYNRKKFSEMLILADALEEAGCDDEDILNHCREDRQHVRGCWVLDLLLGKE